MAKSEDQLSLTARAAWFVVARTLAFGFGLALPLLLVRRLDQYQFGIYKQVFLLVMTAINVLPVGLEMSAFYFLARAQSVLEKRHIIFNILLFYFGSTSLAGLVLVTFPSILSSLFNNPELGSFAPLIAILIPLWGAPFLLQTIAMADQDTRRASLFIVGSELAKSCFLVAAAALTASVKVLIYTAIAHGALQGLLLVGYSAWRFGPFWQNFDWPAMRGQLSYALPFGFASILFRCQTDLHNYYVSHHFDPATYAIYSIGCFNLPLIGIVAYSVGAVMIPRVNFLERLGEKRKIIELASRMMRKLAAVYFPIYVFLLIAGREFITSLFTKQYLASWPIFAINLTMIPLGIITSANDAVMRAHAEQRYFLVRLRLGLIAFLFLALWFTTNRFGLVGAIASVIVVALIEASATAFRGSRILGAEASDLLLFRDVGKLAVAAIVAGVATFLLKRIIDDASPIVVLGVCGFFFSILYLSGIIVMGIVTQKERDWIRNKALSFLRTAASKSEAQA